MYSSLGYYYNMEKSFKRKIATFLISVLRLDDLIQRLYPIALDNRYASVSREDLDVVRGLLALDKQSTLIRMGDNFDGGYAISPNINPLSNCISIGVGTNVSFDIQIAQKLSSVHLYDHTVSALPAKVPQNVFFFQKGLGKDPSETLITLDEMIGRFQSSSPLILKMDIEGSEWEVLAGVSKSVLSRFDQIILELHHLHKVNDKEFFNVVVQSLRNLKETHQIVNRHANNWAKVAFIHGVPVPDVIEITYIKSEESDSTNSDSTFFLRDSYSSANFPCNPNRPDISLCF